MLKRYFLSTILQAKSFKSGNKNPLLTKLKNYGIIIIVKIKRGNKYGNTNEQSNNQKQKSIDI